MNGLRFRRSDRIRGHSIKEVKENEKIYVNQLYNRKFGKKRTKSREKVEVDIGKQNLTVTKVSRPPPKATNHYPSPYDYYKYQ